MTHGCNFLQFLLPSCSRCESFGRVHIAILFMRVRSQTQTGSLRQRLRSLAGDKIHHRYWLLHSFCQYLHIDVRMEVDKGRSQFYIHCTIGKSNYFSDTWCHLNLSLIVFFSSLILIHMGATLYHSKWQPWQRCEYSIIVFFSDNGEDLEGSPWRINQGVRHWLPWGGSGIFKGRDGEPCKSLLQLSRDGEPCKPLLQLSTPQHLRRRPAPRPVLLKVNTKFIMVNAIEQMSNPLFWCASIFSTYPGQSIHPLVGKSYFRIEVLQQSNLLQAL